MGQASVPGVGAETVARCRRGVLLRDQFRRGESSAPVGDTSAPHASFHRRNNYEAARGFH